MRHLIALLLALAAPSTLGAQIVHGTLMESESRVPIAGGVMTLIDRDSAGVAQVTTDSAGQFTLTVAKAGLYRVHAQRLGFRPVGSQALSIGLRDTVQVEFTLARDAVMLEPLVVKARTRRLTAAARRFYERAESSLSGTFITRDDIEKAHPLRTSDLFNRIPGVRTTPMMGGNSITIRGNCRPSVFVDGVWMNGYRSIDDLAQPLNVEGVEVYRSAHEAPPQFTGIRAGCAVVLIWTRLE
jgi:outer membrane receptor protein involved in Fe transport